MLHGLPLTTPARTLQDLAAHLPQHELDRATEQVQLLRLATRDEIAAQLPHRGGRALKAALDDEPKLTRSEAERHEPRAVVAQLAALLLRQVS